MTIMYGLGMPVFTDELVEQIRFRARQGLQIPWNLGAGPVPAGKAPSAPASSKGPATVAPTADGPAQPEPVQSPQTEDRSPAPQPDVDAMSVAELRSLLHQLDRKP